VWLTKKIKDPARKETETPASTPPENPDHNLADWICRKDFLRVEEARRAEFDINWTMVEDDNLRES
jgi:hypothetical protein